MCNYYSILTVKQICYVNESNLDQKHKVMTADQRHKSGGIICLVSGIIVALIFSGRTAALVICLFIFQIIHLLCYSSTRRVLHENMSTIYFSDHTIVVHTYYFSRTETFHCKNRFRGIFLSLLQWRQQQKQSFVFRNKLPFHFTQCDKNWKKWCHKKGYSTIPQFLPSEMEQKKLNKTYLYICIHSKTFAKINLLWILFRASQFKPRWIQTLT